MITHHMRHTTFHPLVTKNSAIIRGFDEFTHRDSFTGMREPRHRPKYGPAVATIGNVDHLQAITEANIGTDKCKAEAENPRYMADGFGHNCKQFLKHTRPVGLDHAPPTMSRLGIGRKLADFSGTKNPYNSRIRHSRVARK
jgi:hypothetical protein